MHAPRTRAALMWLLALCWIGYSGTVLGLAAYASPANDLCITR